MKIYTRTGDAGTTGLFGGDRVPKDSPRIQALGALDELMAALGLARSLGLGAELAGQVQDIQDTLFDLGAEIGMPQPGEPRITEAAVRELETAIDRYDADLEPLRNFILPGGAPGAAALHVARAVCRRTERALVTLNAETPVSDTALALINRLADLLFVMARAANRQAGVEDPIWNPRSQVKKDSTG
jgi:cob(I)alamin adenosyltransferase